MTPQTPFTQPATASQYSRPSLARRIGSAVWGTAKPCLIIGAVGIGVIEGVELSLIGGTNALYCRTAEQRAQSAHMCEVLGHASRDMARGAAALREHGIAGLVLPPTNSRSSYDVAPDVRYVQQPRSSQLTPVTMSPANLADTNAVSLDSLIVRDSLYKR